MTPAQLAVLVVADPEINTKRKQRGTVNDLLTLKSRTGG